MPEPPLNHPWRPPDPPPTARRFQFRLADMLFVVALYAYVFSALHGIEPMRFVAAVTFFTNVAAATVFWYGGTQPLKAAAMAGSLCGITSGIGLALGDNGPGPPHFIRVMAVPLLASPVCMILGLYVGVLMLGARWLHRLILPRREQPPCVVESGGRSAGSRQNAGPAADMAQRRFSPAAMLRTWLAFLPFIALAVVFGVLIYYVGL
jgi:hypothetical protein